MENGRRNNHRHPRKGGGPSLTRAAAAAGGEPDRPPGPAPDPDPGLPRRSGLGPGSRSGATDWGTAAAAPPTLVSPPPQHRRHPRLRGGRQVRGDEIGERPPGGFAGRREGLSFGLPSRHRGARGMSDLLWEPSAGRRAASNMAAFMARANREKGAGANGYAALHRWSVERPDAFWELVWDDAGIVGDKGAAPFVEDGDRMPGARFFPRARLNYAETLLRMRGEAPALIFRREDGLRREWSRDRLSGETSRLAQALAAAGIGEGDRVAAWLPNMPEAVAVMAAAAARGAVFSSCSPDFGAAWGARPLRPDRAAHPVRGGRLQICRARPRHPREAGGGRRRPADGRAGRHHPLSGGRAGHCRRAEGGDAGWVPGRLRAGARRLEPRPLRPAALHPLFLRHDREAQMASSTARAACWR